MREIKLEERVIEYSGGSFNEIYSMFAGDLDRIENGMFSFGFTEDDVFAVKLCCDELFANAYNHGNKKDPGLVVRFEYGLIGVNLPSDLIVYGVFGSVKDRGSGFDPNKLKDPLLEENIDVPNGRGILLVKNYSDWVEFKTDENGFTVNFVRYKQKGL